MEIYKETLDLRWSNPNRDQELEKANAKDLWKHNKNKLKWWAAYKIFLLRHTL